MARRQWRTNVNRNANGASTEAAKFDIGLFVFLPARGNLYG